MIETSTFRITPAHYVRVATGIWLGRWWWVTLLPIAVLIIMSFGNLIYLAAAFALICIVYPAIMMLIYFNHALRPEAAFATIPHRIAISHDGLVINYYPDSEEIRCPPSRVIALSDIANVEDTGSALLLTLTSGKYDIIEIPFTAIDMTDGKKNVTEILKIIAQQHFSA